MEERSRQKLSFSARHRGDPVADEELVGRIQQGDQQAWALFLERYSDLVYGRAREYSRTAPVWSGAQEQEDEVADLYLFMAESVRRSLTSFQGICKPGTWVLSIISNRKQILKAYLLQKDPGRADVRLPRVLKSSSEIDQEIFRRLVWGLDPGGIAWDLNLPEHQCMAVEELLRQRSPRVYERIQANRQAQMPRVSLDGGTEEEGNGPPLQVADSELSPEEQVEQQDLHRVVQEGLRVAIQSLSAIERRVLIMLFNQGLTAAEIVELATEEKSLGKVENVNQCYYLKDRALNQIAAQILPRVKAFAGRAPAPEARRRDLLKQIEELLREQGIPLLRARGERK